MGFWSKLGKIASIAAPIIAAPFTGGASLAAGGFKSALLGAGMGALKRLGDGRLGDIGTTASGAAQGSAEQRRQEADALTRRYAQSLQGARDQSSADLKAAEFTRGEDSRAFERALIANQMERGPLTMGAQIPGAFTPTAPSSQNAPGAANAALLAQLAPLQRIDAPTYRLPMAPGVNAQGIPLDLVQGRGEKSLGGLGLTSKLLSSALGGSGTGAPTPDGLPASFDQAPASPDWKSITGWDGTENIPLPPPDIREPFDQAPASIDWSSILGGGGNDSMPLLPTATSASVTPPSTLDTTNAPIPTYSEGFPTDWQNKSRPQIKDAGARFMMQPQVTQPPLDKLYGEMRGRSFLDDMPNLLPSQKRALEGSQQTANILAAAASVIPAVVLAAPVAFGAGGASLSLTQLLQGGAISVPSLRLTVEGAKGVAELIQRNVLRPGMPVYQQAVQLLKNFSQGVR